MSRSRHARTSAIAAPISIGSISVFAARTHVSTNGWSAKAAESGFGSRAREAARKKSPEPRYSGTNQSRTVSTPLPSTSQIAPRSTHISQRP